MMRTVQSVMTVSSVSAAAFRDLPYSPSLLLPISLPASLASHADVAPACQAGFDWYFEEMYQWNETRDDLVFVPQLHSWSEVVCFVIGNLHVERDRARVLPGHLPSRAWRVGFVLGWLSALALVDRPVALMALEVLGALLEPASCLWEVC